MALRTVGQSALGAEDALPPLGALGAEAALGPDAALAAEAALFADGALAALADETRSPGSPRRRPWAPRRRQRPRPWPPSPSPWRPWPSRRRSSRPWPWRRRPCARRRPWPWPPWRQRPWRVRGGGALLAEGGALRGDGGLLRRGGGHGARRTRAGDRLCGGGRGEGSGHGDGAEGAGDDPRLAGQGLHGVLLWSGATGGHHGLSRHAPARDVPIVALRRSPFAPNARTGVRCPQAVLRMGGRRGTVFRGPHPLTAPMRSAQEEPVLGGVADERRDLGPHGVVLEVEQAGDGARRPPPRRARRRRPRRTRR